MSLTETIFLGSRLTLSAEEDLSSYSRQRTIILYKALAGPVVPENSSGLIIYRLPSKKSSEILDYTLDWNRLLSANEIISKVVWSIFDESGLKTPVKYLSSVQGLKVGDLTTKDNKTTIYLANGVVNQEYTLSCEIQLNSGTFLERGVRLSIKGY